MKPLSCYILTLDSERYLPAVLSAARRVAEDLVVVDSGSRDATERISRAAGARFVVRVFDDFSSHRNFAFDQCENDWVLWLDSDEVPDEDCLASIRSLKEQDFEPSGESFDAFSVCRRWFVMGKEVGAFYPMQCPDYPVRLARRDRIRTDGRVVHETPTGFNRCGEIRGSLTHYTADSVSELYRKLDLYTTLFAQDLHARGFKGTTWDVWGRPFFAWLKWYVGKKGWKDGRLGRLLARYAAHYTYLAFLKLRYDMQDTFRAREGMLHDRRRGR